jgi:hypothetical protein
MHMFYTPFFSVNSVVTVIMLSGDYILKIYDIVITRHVKAKFQDREAHLKQCQGQNPGQGSTPEKMLRQRSKTRKQT